MSALATVSRKSFKGKFTAKIDFPIGYFMLPSIADADIGSLKSLHTLFDKYWDQINAGEIWTKSYGLNLKFELFNKKMANHFWQSVDWWYFGRPFCNRNSCLMLNY